MRRKLLTISIIFILMMTLIPLPGSAGTAPAEQPAAQSQNPAIQQQPANKFSRQSPYAGTEKGLNHWVYESGLHTTSTPVIGPDGTAYFTAGKELVAVDCTGKKLWSWHCAVTLTNSPELGNGEKILVTSEAGDLFALNSSGSELWTFRHTPPKTDDNMNAAVASCSSCSTGPDGTVYYVICYDSPGTTVVTLYAVDPYGTLKWSSKTEAKGTLAGKPVINNDGTIFIEYMRQALVSSGGRFSFPILATYVAFGAYKLNGDFIWENKIVANNLLNITPFCPDSEAGILVGVEKTLYLLNLSGQHRLFECGELFRDANGIALTNDGKIVFTSGSSAYLCDTEGALQWKFDADSNTTSIPLVDKKGNTFFSSSRGSLYCLDTQGKEKWKSMLTGEVYGSSPMMRNDGVIYQLTGGGDLNAVGKIKVKSVSLNAHKVTLLSKGMKGILKPNYSPVDTTDNAMEWSSSNPSVATVKDGVITPVSAGKTLIKVYSQTDNISDTCEITVVTKPETDMALTCDTVLTRTLSFYQSIFTFQNLTLNDGVTLTSEGTSETELVVKGVLNIGKNASIRVRNGSYSSAPALPVSSLSAETLKKAATLRDANILSIPGIYGKGGNGGNGGNGSLVPSRNNIPLASRMYQEGYNGGGGGGGGYGGGTGGNGGSGKVYSRYGRELNNDNRGIGRSGENDGKNGGSSLGFSILYDITIPGGQGGGELKTGSSGVVGYYTGDGASGGGGNGGSGGAGMFGSMFTKQAVTGYLGGGGGGGGGYGGGVLVIAAGSIKVNPGNIPCFIVSGQVGGKGGYPDGKDGENGEGGLLVIETNSYRPSLSHWNIGTGSIECNNPGINGGHGTVTGNPQKVFINGRDMGGYDDKTIKAFNTGDRSAALILELKK